MKKKGGISRIWDAARRVYFCPDSSYTPTGNYHSHNKS